MESILQTLVRYYPTEQTRRGLFYHYEVIFFHAILKNMQIYELPPNHKFATTMYQAYIPNGELHYERERQT